MDAVSTLLSLLAPLLLVTVWSTPRATWHHISHLFRTLSSTHLHLSTTPRDRFSSLLTVSLAILLLLLKHLGLGPAIKSQNVKRDGTLPLPDLRITAPISISQKELGNYNDILQVVESVDRSTESESHETPLLLLAPLITPLISSLLILRKSPIKPLGAVNVRNTFIFHRPELLRRLGRDLLSGNHASREILDNQGKETMNKEVQEGREGDGMVVRAQMGGELLGRKMKRGVEFDTILTVSTASTPTTPDVPDPIFSFTFTTLSLLPLRSAPLHPSAMASKPDDDLTIRWYADPSPLSLSAKSPLLWARLSKDYNPIHTSSICAKMLGLRGKIAHGNMVLSLVVSRACQAYISGEGVSEEQKELGEIWTGDKGACWLTVEFRRPVFVPSRPLVRWGKGRVQVYEVVKAKKGVEGEVGKGEEVKVLVDIRAGLGMEVPRYLT